MIKDIIKKAIIDKAELTAAEKNELLLYFELNELDASVKVYDGDLDRMSAVQVVEDLTSQITGTNSHFTLLRVAREKCTVSCNLPQQPGSIDMDADMQGFSLSYTPTTNDKLIVEYFS